MRVLLNFQILFFLLLSLAAHAGDPPISSGGNSTGVRQANGKFVLAEFANHPNYQKNTRVAEKIPVSKMAQTVALDDFDIKTTKAYQLLEQRLSLWQKDAPATVAVIRRALSHMIWAQTPLKVRLPKDKRKEKHAAAATYYILEQQTSTDPKKIAAGTHTIKHEIALISLPIFNNFDTLESQAGAIAREALRHAQNFYDSRLTGTAIKDSAISTIVSRIVLDSPPQASQGKGEDFFIDTNLSTPDIHAPDIASLLNTQQKEVNLDEIKGNGQAIQQQKHAMGRGYLKLACNNLRGIVNLYTSKHPEDKKYFQEEKHIFESICDKTPPGARLYYNFEDIEKALKPILEKGLNNVSLPSEIRDVKHNLFQNIIIEMGINYAVAGINSRTKAYQDLAQSLQTVMNGIGSRREKFKAYVNEGISYNKKLDSLIQKYSKRTKALIESDAYFGPESDAAYESINQQFKNINIDEIDEVDGGDANQMRSDGK